MTRKRSRYYESAGQLVTNFINGEAPAHRKAQLIKLLKELKTDTRAALPRLRKLQEVASRHEMRLWHALRIGERIPWTSQKVQDLPSDLPPAYIAASDWSSVLAALKVLAKPKSRMVALDEDGELTIKSGVVELDDTGELVTSVPRPRSGLLNRFRICEQCGDWFFARRRNLQTERFCKPQCRTKFHRDHTPKVQEKHEDACKVWRDRRARKLERLAGSTAR